ncbi:MAG: hydroxymethylbilane synthase [bacterium]|nr:hydroxymethylbilane synthase [bacterium]
MKKRTLILGTRGSQLAIQQAEWVKSRLLKKVPGITVKLEKITTTGDKFRGTTWSKAPTKGVFTKELEEALLAKKIDFAVHSLKDVPTELPDGLALVAFPKRADAHDAIIFNRSSQVHVPDEHGEETLSLLDTLPEKARVGTSSLRRQSQLLHFRPDLVMVELRGNLNTRIEKLEQEGLDAIIVAAAGLARLKIKHEFMHIIPFEIMLPAVGQGAIAIESRAADKPVITLLQQLNDKKTELAITAERSFLAGLGGGCRLPIAAYARVEQNKLILDGLIASPDGSKFIRSRIETDMLTIPSAVELGNQLAQKLLSAGAGQILQTRTDIQ